MTSAFATAMNESATTWNGAVSLATPDVTGETSGRVGLYFKSVRGLNIPRLYQYLREAAQESIVDAFLLAFHIRDCRGGKGERELGRKALIWLFLNYSAEFMRVAPLVAEYGRWDDLLQFWPGVLNLNDLAFVRANYCANVQGGADLARLRDHQQVFVKLMADQLVTDRKQMEASKKGSICAKWAPTEGDSSDRKHGVVALLCGKMGITPRQYRKEYASPLRQQSINIVERMMCEGRWYEIDFSAVPSCAMKRLKKAFERHYPEGFNAWKEQLKKGEVTVKAKQLQPHELVREIRTRRAADEVCEAQWKVLEAEVEKLGSLEDAVIMVDTSGSMQSPDFLPMDVAVALGLIISNAVKGQFHNHVMTFDTTPAFVQIRPGSLYNRWNQVSNIPWGGSTNIQGAFDLVLERARSAKLTPEQMPKRFFIVSDMQFNQVQAYSGEKQTNFHVIDTKFKKYGYTRPQIVFWNVNGASTDFPVTVRDDGTALISGFSPAVMKAIITGKDMSPYTVLRDTLDGERYKPVRDALTPADLVPAMVEVSLSDTEDTPAPVVEVPPRPATARV